MQARMTNPAMVLPDGMKGIQAIIKGINSGGLEQQVMEIAGLRASQINGCAPCVYGHSTILRKSGMSEEKIAAVAAWRHSPFFTDAEVGALKLTEAMTRLADRSDEAVPDALWDEVADLFDEKALSALLLSISLTNMFNRLNTALAEPAGKAW